MNFQQELETLIRARYPILYVVTSEETRVQNLIVPIATKRQKKSLNGRIARAYFPPVLLFSPRNTATPPRKIP